MPIPTAIAAGSVVIAAAVPGGGVVPVLYAVIGLLAMLAYTHWSTRLDRVAAPALKVGGLLPSFPVCDDSGAPVDVARYRGRRALFLFFRGNWCPLCMAQIKEVSRQYRELEARGVKVVLVSPQPERATRDLAGRFDVPFDFLVDRDAAAARALGITHDGGVPAGFGVLGYDANTVLPTAILVDEEGRILFTHETDNYRVRPEPETFLRALDAISK
jgi:peroxiredoxin